MMSELILERTLEKQLIRQSRIYKVLTLMGPRQAGKSTTVLRLFKDYNYVNLEDYSIAREALSDPKGFLVNHPSPLIIDEIQKCPQILGQIQANVDRDNQPGQYILTGSAQLDSRHAVSQSLAGRTAVSTLLPLSLEELSGAGITLERNEQLFTGFMPELYRKGDIPPSEYYQNYKLNYLEKDIRDLRTFRNLREFHMFLDALAGRAGQVLNSSSISKLVGVSSTTISDWISLLETAYVVYLLPAWTPNDNRQNVKSPKLYFIETGLLTSFTRVQRPSDLDIHYLTGAIFENMVVIEALKSRCNSAATPDLYFYRNSKGVEIDLMLCKADNEYDLFEIKAAYSIASDQAANMRRFSALYPRLKVSMNVIYAGETLKESVNGVRYINFRDIAPLFKAPAAFVPSLGR